MSTLMQPTHVAVVGAGLAGVSCAAALARAGARVTVFDKSRAVGGRLATRRVVWAGEDGADRLAEIDHGAQHFEARQPRFRAAVARAMAAGCVAAWQPDLHFRGFPRNRATVHVAVPTMPALCRHLLGDLPRRLDWPVRRLQHGDAGWTLLGEDGSSAGPFDQLVLALPPSQAAALLAPHHGEWAQALATVRMDPCWALMAVTDDVDWPWDAAEPDRGPLAWVARNDRKPGRAAPAGCAVWVAHATTAWSAAHLEEDPLDVADALGAALRKLLPGHRPLRWHHRSAHRWRYAAPTGAAPDAREFWWDATLGLGVCGDFLAGGDVEAAWRSGDELADTLAAWLDERLDAAVTA